MIQLINNPELIQNIYHLGVQNQMLMHRALDLWLVPEARQCRKLDHALISLLHKATHFDFIGQVAQGRTLLVGEGNLSFSLNLARSSRIVSSRLLTTTFETNDELSEEAIENAQVLKARGVTVVHGVDATDLGNTFGSWLFDNIIFQFPHVGYRGAEEGRNPNFILIRDFLLSAFSQLHRNGRVLITTANTPHYRGAFQFEEAAETAGFQPPEVYPFDPSQFPGYEHTMTHQSSSALENHDTFSTWIFRI